MSILIMILLLSLLILVHEAGHFLTAKLFGMRVDKFGFGLPIGPTLFKTKIGEVEILVHAFLLGGYVAFPDDDKECDLPEDSPERFSNRPIYQRALVISAGVIANVLCAFFLVLLVATWTKHLPSGEYNIYTASISAKKEASILQSGLEIGDKILSANGCDIKNVYSFVTIVKNSAKNNGIVSQGTISENYNMLKALNPGLEKNEIIPAEIAVRLPQMPAVDIITMDKYAAMGAKIFKKEGVRLSDNLIKLGNSISGKSVYMSEGNYSLNDIATAISDGAHPINLTVKRGDSIIKLKPIYPDKEGLIGIGLKAEQIMIDTKNPISAAINSTKYLCHNTYVMIYSLGQLFTGNIPFKEMHGVVAITKIGSDMIDKTGKSSGILLAALISMNLAILNILPIPALDGGHLLFLLVEKIMRIPIDEKIVEKISTVFFTLLIILMVFVIFNDITLIINR